MKRRDIKSIFLLAIALFGFSYSVISQNVAISSETFAEDSLKPRLRYVVGIKDSKSLNTVNFKEKYEIKFEQPVDHKNPRGEKFTQRVFVMHKGFDKPTVIITEGYSANYAANPRYREEVSTLLDANVVFVEHRYFSESTPTNRDWKYLTAENAANDLHRIRTALGYIYKQKWIATGISKGGQNALIYTAYFPNDVDVTVPYVAPLCSNLEDGRHEPFISKSVGKIYERVKIEDLQKEILKRRPSLQPKFDSLILADKLTFSIPTEEVYDYSVLEISFAFWQMGFKRDIIPTTNISDNELFKYWISISSPEYFQKEGDNTPFFVQAAKELGYYGYDTKPFGGLLKINTSKNYLSKIFLPENYSVTFDPSLYNKLSNFVKTTSNKMMFIYGEYDPWSSVKIDEPKSKNIVVLIEPEGSHRARISSLPLEMRNRAISQLKKWLETENK